MEALLRSCIQHLKNVCFIFCGSRKDMVTNIFSNAKRPFFASIQYIVSKLLPMQEESVNH
jgi:hypothetical protein